MKNEKRVFPQGNYCRKKNRSKGKSNREKASDSSNRKTKSHDKAVRGERTSDISL